MPLALKLILTALDECFVSEIQNGSKRFFLTVLCCSPSQSTEQFSLFKQRWEERINNINDCSPTIAMYIIDFNARNTVWWNGDFTNLQGTELAELAAHYSLNQIIDGYTHILSNSASCIDSIFTMEANFNTELEVLSLLFPSCHHQLNFAKISFTTFFPPACGQRIWHFSGLTSMLSGKLLIAWIGIGNSTAEILMKGWNFWLRLFWMFVPSKVIIMRSKDTLWMTPDIKRMTLEKAKTYWCYV